MTRAGRRSDSLTNSQDTQLRTLWHDKRYTVADIARMLGTKQWTVSDAARRLGLGKKAYSERKYVADPSPDEIAAACREIRETHWTDEEYELRATASSPRWIVPMCDFEGSNR